MITEYFRKLEQDSTHFSYIIVDNDSPGAKYEGHRHFIRFEELSGGHLILAMLKNHPGNQRFMFFFTI